MFTSNGPARADLVEQQRYDLDPRSGALVLSLDPPAITMMLPGAGELEKAMFAAGPIVMGRSPSCDLHIRDQWVSRRQCALELFDDDRLAVRDLESKNGTRVNNDKVARRELHEGDVVRVGLTSFRFVGQGADLHAG